MATSATDSAVGIFPLHVLVESIAPVAAHAAYALEVAQLQL
jgi:hypothetical protein